MLIELPPHCSFQDQTRARTTTEVVAFCVCRRREVVERARVLTTSTTTSATAFHCCETTEVFQPQPAAAAATSVAYFITPTREQYMKFITYCLSVCIYYQDCTESCGRIWMKLFTKAIAKWVRSMNYEVVKFWVPCLPTGPELLLNIILSWLSG